MAHLSARSSLGVALIGAGMIGKMHVTALSGARDRVQLKAIISRRPERSEYLSEFYEGQVPTFTSDLAAVVEDPDIHFAIVATPPSVRTELIEKLAKAGKHILLEKPVARTTEEATQVVEICEREGVSLGILFQHRVRTSSKAALQQLQTGKLGRLGHVEIAVPLWRDQSYYDELGRGTYARDGGGVLITQAIHTIDLALSLTGPVTKVQAMAATTPLHKMEAEDFAVAGLQFASGAVGSFVANTASFPHGTEMISLHFENGSMRLGRETLDLAWRDRKNRIETPVKDDESSRVEKHEWHQAVIEEFVDAIHERRAPLVTGREALRSHRLIEAIETSSKTGKIVDVSDEIG